MSPPFQAAVAGNAGGFAGYYRAPMSRSEGDDVTAEPVRETSAAMRWLVVPFTLLAGLGAIQLYVFPQDTDRFFAWTLQPQHSAMFMGAGFAAGVVLTTLSFRRQPWASTRTAAYTIFVFVSGMTLATLVHIDLMHLDSDVGTARLAAWGWTAVYVVIVPVLGFLIYRQHKQPGTDPVSSMPLPGGLRTALTVEGGVMVVVGLALFIAPATVAGWWPWPVTPFSGRALASWIVSIGVAALWASFEHDRHRLRPAAITFTVVSALWLVAVARGTADIFWERPAAWFYLAFVIMELATGAWGAVLTTEPTDDRRLS
jgi:hypothetical protein